MSFRMRRGRTSFSVGPRGPRASYRLGCLLPVLLVAGAVAAACGGPSSPAGPAQLVPTVTARPATAAPRATTKPAPAAYYANCTEARAAGVTPLREGQPGYRSALDRDGDGVACE